MKIVRNPVLQRVWVPILTVLLSLVGPALLAEDGQAEPAAPSNYWMVFITRAENPPEVSDERKAELQKAHVAHLMKVQKDGYCLVAGPFEAGDEEELRGLLVFRGDLERQQVEELASADPAVVAGLRNVRVVKWWIPPGTVQIHRPGS